MPQFIFEVIAFCSAAACSWLPVFVSSHVNGLILLNNPLPLAWDWACHGCKGKAKGRGVSEPHPFLPKGLHTDPGEEPGTSTKRSNFLFPAFCAENFLAVLANFSPKKCLPRITFSAGFLGQKLSTPPPPRWGPALWLKRCPDVEGYAGTLCWNDRGRDQPTVQTTSVHVQNPRLRACQGRQVEGVQEVNHTVKRSMRTPGRFQRRA